MKKNCNLYVVAMEFWTINLEKEKLCPCMVPSDLSQFRKICILLVEIIFFVFLLMTAVRRNG